MCVDHLSKLRMAYGNAPYNSGEYKITFWNNAIVRFLSDCFLDQRSVASAIAQYGMGISLYPRELCWPACSMYMVFRLPTHLESLIPPPSEQISLSRPWRGAFVLNFVDGGAKGSSQEICVTAVETEGDR
jgi:hypothetical protein